MTGELRKLGRGMVKRLKSRRHLTYPVRMLLFPAICGVVLVCILHRAPRLAGCYSAIVRKSASFHHICNPRHSSLQNGHHAQMEAT